ncbi:TonB-dependent receptor plug domain-containing protein (plasmid) [Glycocaulis abyssi]|uniref:TonB-dependent receptor plug domain-containing protein n=1 Tax=Glycocaulis abyssi TaxID=1433403 RepID=A0ABV9NCN4_9PROT
MGVRTSFRQGLLCAAAIITAMAMPADTLALEPAEFTIEAAPLGDALRAFSQQSGRAILFSEGTVSGLTAPRLTGTYEPEAALGLLLQGTGLEFTQGPNGNLIVRRQTGADPVQTPEPGRGRGREVSGEPDPETDSRRIETITVTGTSIRGIAPESSPFQMFTREEIFESGLASTEQFLRTIPQLFGGGSSEFVPVTLPNDSNSGQNNTAGSSANLRGLGSRGTLVLLNGNRVAPSSQIGDFVDLSLIPVSAIERIDLLTDGASSIYGGDAIAGVVNFILRDDFDGAETSLRYGNVTSGDMREIRLSQTLGRAWGSGNLLATYEYYDRDALSLADRPDIDIFPPRTPSVVLPDPAFFSLLPGQERHSGVISVRQDFQDLSCSPMFGQFRGRFKLL